MTARSRVWERLARRVGPWLVWPTPRMAALAALVAPLWLLSASRPGFIVAGMGAILVVVAFAVDAALLPSPADVTVERDALPLIGIGEESILELTVENRSATNIRVSLRDELPPAFFQPTVPPPLLTVAAGERTSLARAVTGRARGRTLLGRIGVRVRTTAGLASRRMIFAPGDEMVIAPSIAGVKKFRALALQNRLAIAGVRDARRLGDGRSFARLREYVPGDDPRQIDWKASARRTRLITREYSIERSQTVMLMVDAGRSMTQQDGSLTRFERALSAALLLADVAATTGDRVGALVFDDQPRLFQPPLKGGAVVQALRSALIPILPSFVEPDYAAAFRMLAIRQRKRALIVIFTDVLDARAARHLIGQLSRSAGRHLAVVVAMRNQALAAAAEAPTATTLDVYRVAAAEELITERAVGLQRMRDAGIVVLDVVPGAVATAVVNQYLTLKARGAL